jgi:hypothetical protein
MGRNILRACSRTRLSCLPDRPMQRFRRDRQTPTSLLNPQTPTHPLGLQMRPRLSDPRMRSTRTTFAQAWPFGPFALWLKSGGLMRGAITVANFRRPQPRTSPTDRCDDPRRHQRRGVQRHRAFAAARQRCFMSQRSTPTASGRSRPRMLGCVSLRCGAPARA